MVTGGSAMPTCSSGSEVGRRPHVSPLAEVPGSGPALRGSRRWGGLGFHSPGRASGQRRLEGVPSALTLRLGLHVGSAAPRPALSKEQHRRCEAVTEPSARPGVCLCEGGTGALREPHMAESSREPTVACLLGRPLSEAHRLSPRLGACVPETPEERGRIRHHLATITSRSRLPGRARGDNSLP